MSKVQIGKLDIDPAVTPAVLDTVSWDNHAISVWCASLDEHFYRQAQQLIHARDASLTLCCNEVTCYPGSAASHGGASYVIAGFPDGQAALMSIGSTRKQVLAGELYQRRFNEEFSVSVFPADYENLYRYSRFIHPKKGPRALGTVPRLGIGNRHSTTQWDGIWRGVYSADISANCIQNSVRELHLLQSLADGQPPAVNHLFSFGPLQEGHTGSTFEGLWTYGVLHGLKHPRIVRYGADADHLQVKRGDGGIERTKKFISASRYYSFYTIDVSDILDYSALGMFSASGSAGYLDSLIPDSNQRRDILWYHRQKKSLGKQYIELDEAYIGRLVGKYWKALQALEDLYLYLDSIKDGEPYDLELSIDENPPFVKTFDTITTPAELLFLVDEIARRGLPITHIAPNFGVEKGTDYRGDDGLEMLGDRVRLLHRIASESGIMLDCHSGDDLSRETRRTFGRAAGGSLHFKISPCLQTLFGEVLSEFEPELFGLWWKDTLEYARQCSDAGGTAAKHALSLVTRSSSSAPSPFDLFFREFCFASVGKRDSDGSFMLRDRFYNLSDEFLQELNVRTERMILEAAEDLFIS